MSQDVFKPTVFCRRFGPFFLTVVLSRCRSSGKVSEHPAGGRRFNSIPMTDQITTFTVADDATKFTLAYLEIIERNLEISYTSQGEPICLPGKIRMESLSNLTEELNSLIFGEIGSNAIAAAKVYGKQHIQSIGFGHVSDFDAFVKTGFLCSERVVVWDILNSRILRPDNMTDDAQSVIADIACNLLLLRPVVELGGAAVLPHPLTWSEKARAISVTVPPVQKLSPSALGLLFAIAAIDDGLPLHPFTLATKPKPNTVSVHYSSAAHDLAFGLSSLMKDSEFSFLRTMRLVDFYRTTLNYPDLYRALRQRFASLAGLSPQASQKEVDALIAELKKLSGERDKAIANYWLDSSIASASVVTGTLTMTTSHAGATLLALLGLTPAAITAVRRLLARPSKNVIVQAFSDFATATPFHLELSTVIPDIGAMQNAAPGPDLAAHLESIRSADWTEDAHRYLEELDEDTAAAVLDALPVEQIDQLVNFRSRQEDYIGDYLEFVWHANPQAFWRHIDLTFRSDEGMLMYDLDGVHTVLTSEDMPLSVWMTLLRFIPRVYSTLLKSGKALRYKQDSGSVLADFQIGQLVEVISFQLLESSSKLQKQSMLRLWLSNLSTDEKATADLLLPIVFPAGLPGWLS
jgi:mRNA-degrading endonuclease toxin of MazEF toxin-antitoxin module